MSIDLKARAERARQLLEDEMLVDAFEAVERCAIDNLAQARVSDPAALIEYTAALQAVRAVRQQIQSFVTTGRLSDRQGPDVA